MYDLSNLLEKKSNLKRIYSCGKRYYTDSNEIRYMSVTTMLSGNTEDAIALWREQVGDAEADSITNFASNIGSLVHEMVENHLQNIENDYTYYGLLPTSIYRSFQPHLKHITNILGIELQLYSHSLKLAGTADLIADYKGELSLIDHKTSKSPKKIEWLDNYFLQATCYCIMVKELYGITIKNIVLFIGSRDGEFQVVKRNPIDYIKPLLVSNKKLNPLV